MIEKFTINIDTAKFDTRVSFLPRLVGSDLNPVTRPYEDIVNDFLRNAVYGAEVAEAKQIKDDDALQEFKNNRPAIIAQCLVKSGVDKKDMVAINHIVKFDIDLKNILLVEVVYPVVKMLFGPYALAIYKTVSGRGLQMDVLIDDPEKKATRYNEITSILKSHRIPVDDCFKNIVQKSVLSYDANGFFNSDPLPFTGSIDPGIETQVRELTGRQKKSNTKDDEEKEPTKKKAIRFISENYNLRKNLLIHDVELDGESVSDYVLNSITIDCNDAGINIDKNFVATYVGSDRVPSFHPLLELYEKNKHRDFKGAIDKFAACVVTKKGTRLDHNVFFKKWRVKGIAQVFEPLVSNELCPIYIGPPGIGKTWFLENLYSGELARYSCALPIVKTTDFSIELTLNLAISDQEYRARKLDDDNYFKSILTLAKVKVRRPYERTPVTLKRIASLCASSNDAAIIKDTNRRIIPIEVERFLWDEFDALDALDLYLDAYHLYKTGYDYNLTKEEGELLKEVSRDYEVTNIEEEAVLTFFPKAHSLEAADEFMTVGQMISLANIYGKISLTPNRVTSILNRYGYCRKMITVHSSKTGEKTSRIPGWGIKEVDFVAVAARYMAKDLRTRKYVNLD